jgi:predicted nucleotidyltransferase
MGSGIPGPTLRFDPMVDVPESLTLDERRVIDRWIEVLREEIDREPVWLFGSVARGERREGLDVDLLVITRGDAERDRQRVWRTVDEVAREMVSIQLPSSRTLGTARGWRAVRRAPL